MDDFETHPAGTADLVKRLRDWTEYDEGKVNDTRHEAADRIEQLVATVEQLEVALTRANAATAAAYEVAAREVECGCVSGPCQDTANCAAKDAAAIRALATPDQTAALDKLIEPYVEVLGVVLAWHDKDKHTAGKMTFERSSTFAKVRATLSASKKGGPQMTDLIPLDAAIAAVNLAIWKSPIKAQISTIDASNDTAEALRAIPTIDPAAIREAALREALDAVSRAAWKHNGDDSYSAGLEDGARKQNEDDYEAILALIGEKK